MHTTAAETYRELEFKDRFYGPRLREAIPFINQFRGKDIVLKLGGAALDAQPSALSAFVENVVFLKNVGINVVLVHGASKQLDAELTRDGIKTYKINGLRVTTQQILGYAQRVFSDVSKSISAAIKKRGYRTFILDWNSGLIKSEKIDAALGMGLVGLPKKIDIDGLRCLADDVVPIISAITGSVDDETQALNVNADDVAGAIAGALRAEKLILMTDEDGVCDKFHNLISTLRTSQIESLIQGRTIAGGMIPKVRTCAEALKKGVNKCHIIKATADTIIDEVLTKEGVGTEVVNDLFI
jgi:acetylglutamate kinase